MLNNNDTQTVDYQEINSQLQVFDCQNVIEEISPNKTVINKEIFVEIPYENDCEDVNTTDFYYCVCVNKNHRINDCTAMQFGLKSSKKNFLFTVSKKGL